MDSNNEMMMHQLVQEEEDVAADKEEKLLIMAALLRLCVRINAPPWRGSFRPRKKKNKDQQRMQGAVMLESDYFADNAIHTPLEFWHRFRMNKELFMKIVVGVWEYDGYFCCKKDCIGFPGFTFI
jgi:hypothetical protein